MRRLILFVVLLGWVLAACNQPTPMPTPTATPLPQVTAAPVVQPTQPPAAPSSVGPTPIGPYGPTGFPADVNPITGLTVSDPSVLQRRPLLIKISNSPPVVRPQSGLMSADHVWEHQMEGFAITRFTAVFLSQTPEKVGSVRSGRLPDLELVPMYGGLFVASGYSSNFGIGGPPRNRELFRAAPWFERNFSADFGYGAPYSVRFPREGLATEHTLFAVPTELWRLAAEKGFNQKVPLEPGLAFNLTAPSGGTATTEMTIDYPGTGPKDTWRYDAATGRWLRWTDDQIHGDALTNVQVAFDNIVIVYAPHHEADFIEDEHAQLKSVGITLTGEGDAVLLRDGQRYTAHWRRANVDSMIQFFDASGAVIPFKPGTTWFHLADTVIFGPTVTYLP